MLAVMALTDHLIKQWDHTALDVRTAKQFYFFVAIVPKVVQAGSPTTMNSSSHMKTVQTITRTASTT